MTSEQKYFLILSSVRFFFWNLFHTVFKFCLINPSDQTEENENLLLSTKILKMNKIFLEEKVENEESGEKIDENEKT